MRTIVPKTAAEEDAEEFRYNQQSEVLIEKLIDSGRVVSMKTFADACSRVDLPFAPAIHSDMCAALSIAYDRLFREYTRLRREAAK